MTRCVICRSDFKRRSMTQKACSTDCAERYGREKAIADADKQKRKEAKADRLDTRERKDKLKSKSEIAKEAQIIVNKYIVARDKDLPCISCDSMTSYPTFHCGHYRSVGSSPHLRYETLNLAKQCARCNTHLVGNIVNYRIGLVKRIGLDQVEALEADQRPRHYTIQDLQGIKASFREKLKELKNGR